MCDRSTYRNLFFAVFCTAVMACGGSSNCGTIDGAWTDREGHGLVFKPDGKVLWLNKFGQMVDTITGVFILNCNVRPATLDMKDFSDGPFLGKTLFGIIEWSADSVFRWCYEVGSDPGQRPKVFDPESTLKFFK